MKEHEAGGKTKAKCTSFGWRRFNTSRRGGERVGSPVLRSETAEGGLRAKLLAKMNHKERVSPSVSAARPAHVRTGGSPGTNNHLCASVCVCVAAAGML